MRYRRSINLAILLILVLLLIPNVNAIGITPGRKTVQYQSGQKINGEVTLLNSENKQTDFIIYAEGVLAEYVEFSTTSISFEPDDLMRTFSYSVILPEWLSEHPGTHETRIIVRSIDSPSDSEIMNIKANVALIHQFRVNVVYPGKLARADLIIDSGDPILFIVPVFSIGEKDIDEAKVLIDVFDLNGNIISSVETESKSIKSSNRRDFAAEISISEPGLYLATATINYDGKTTSTSRVFTVGDDFIELIDVYVNNFLLGQIAQFNLRVGNIANVVVKDAHTEIVLKDDANNEVANIKGISENIKAGEEKTLLAFWNTEGVDADTYKGKINVIYDDNRTIEKFVTMQVMEDEIITSFGGVTGQVIGSNEEVGLTGLGITMLVMVLIITNIILFLYINKLKNKKK